MEQLRSMLVISELSGLSRLAQQRAALLAGTIAIGKVDNLEVGHAHPGVAALAHVNCPTGAPGRANLLGRSARRPGSGTASAIANYADAVDASVVVLGARAKNLLTELFIRNTNDELVRICRRPVLVVKTSARSAYANVLVATDFSDASFESAALALRLAPSARFTFLHVYDVPWLARRIGVPAEEFEREKTRARLEAGERLDEFIADLDVGARQVAVAIEYGDPAGCIAEYARRAGTDLLVAGKQGKTRIDEVLVGSVTQEIKEKARCDVLIGLAATRRDLRPAA